MKPINQKHLAVLKRIQASVPKELTDKLMKTEKMAPAVREVFERGLDDPEVPEEQKTKMRLILDSGVLDKTVERADPEIEARIDAYIEGEMKKAIARGELPKKLLKYANKK
jgi:hypothetical protein